MRKLKQHELDLIADLRDTAEARDGARTGVAPDAASRGQTRASAFGRPAPHVWLAVAGVNILIVFCTAALAVTDRSGFAAVLAVVLAAVFFALELVVGFFFLLTLLPKQGVNRPDRRIGRHAKEG